MGNASASLRRSGRRQRGMKRPSGYVDHVPPGLSPGSFRVGFWTAKPRGLAGSRVAAALGWGWPSGFFDHDPYGFDFPLIWLISGVEQLILHRVGRLLHPVVPKGLDNVIDTSVGIVSDRGFVLETSSDGFRVAVDERKNKIVGVDGLDTKRKVSRRENPEG